VVQLQEDLQELWTWDSMEPNQEIVRPMANLITPTGLLGRVIYDKSTFHIYPDSQTEPMPCRVGAWISTEKGNHRLTLPELGRGLGLSKKSSEENLIGYRTYN